MQYFLPMIVYCHASRRTSFAGKDILFVGEPQFSLYRRKCSMVAVVQPSQRFCHYLFRHHIDEPGFLFHKGIHRDKQQPP